MKHNLYSSTENAPKYQLFYLGEPPKQIYKHKGNLLVSQYAALMAKVHRSKYMLSHKCYLPLHPWYSVFTVD